jgi:hypothetical protein
VSVAEWADGAMVASSSSAAGGKAAADPLARTHEAGSEAGILFGPYRVRGAADPLGLEVESVPQSQPQAPQAAPMDEAVKTWDRRSTAIPEVPTLLLGDTDGGTIETLRIRALGPGKSIDLWQVLTRGTLELLIARR